MISLNVVATSLSVTLQNGTDSLQTTVFDVGATNKFEILFHEF